MDRRGTPATVHAGASLIVNSGGAVAQNTGTFTVNDVRNPRWRPRHGDAMAVTFLP